MGFIPIQIVNVAYTDGVDCPIFHVTGYSSDGKRHYLMVTGKRVVPSFGVPYEEFWKIYQDKRIRSWKRGPDSPFGEPVIEVETMFPDDVGSGKNAMRNFVSHSYQADIKFEKKVMNALGMTNGYFAYDISMLIPSLVQVSGFDFCGTLNDMYIIPFDPKDDRFLVPTRDVVWDSEWDISMLVNEYKEQRRPELNLKDFQQMKVFTVVFLDTKTMIMEAFSWHPDQKARASGIDSMISRVKGKARERLPHMPTIFHVNVHGFPNESSMLDGIIEWWGTFFPDCSITFNGSGGIFGKGDDKFWMSGFDMPYLFMRCKFLGKPVHRLSPCGEAYERKGVPAWTRFNVEIKLVTQFDTLIAAEYLDITQKEYRVKNKQLGTLMKYFLDVGKVEHEGSVSSLHFNNPKDARYYCQGDVEGTFWINEMFNMSKDGYNRAMFSGAKWEDWQFASKLHDQINLRLYKDLYYLDTKWQGERDDDGNEMKNEFGKRIKWERDWIKEMEPLAEADNLGEDGEFGEDGKVGGHVQDVMVGFHENVAILDFEKFYPNSAIASNCGPETYINLDNIKITPKGIMLVDRRRCLRREITDWDSFITEMKKTFDYNPTNEELQQKISSTLLGWKLEEIPFEQCNWTPAGFFKKTPIAKNVRAFEELAQERGKMQKKAKGIFKATKNKNDPEFKKYDLLQSSYKGLTNARFGITGMEEDRTYMRPIFNTFTLVAQSLIREVIRHLQEDLHYIIIGGDTDSIFLKLQQPIKWIEKDVGGKTMVLCEEMDNLCEDVNKHIWKFAVPNHNFDRNTFNMDCENIAGGFFIVAKKHYMFASVWKEGVRVDPRTNIYWKGVKYVSRSVALIADDVQETLAAVIFFGKKDEAEKYCLKVHEEFHNYSPIYVCKTVPLKKPLGDYKTGSEQWKAYTMANKYFNAGYELGARCCVGKIKYCPKIINGKTVDDNLGTVIAFDEETLPKILETGIKFDYDFIEDASVAAAADEVLLRYGSDVTYWKIIDNARTWNPFAF